jgi:hypothetical protein
MLFGWEPRLMKKAYFIFAMLCVYFVAESKNLFSQTISESEKKRKLVVEKMDKAGLRFQTQAVVEKSKDMLKIPESVKHLDGFTVAKTPPEINFVIVPFENRYFQSVPENYFSGIWSNWSQGNYYAPTKKFYCAIGSHGFYKPQLYIVEYDTQSKSIKTSSEINDYLGRADAKFGDGKIHGWLDFYNGAELYFCSYWCQYPEPSEEEFQSGYEGGAILSYDVVTNKFTNFGVPMPRSSWPYHRMDTRRGFMFAVGMFGEFLCYDVNKKETRFAGYLPDGMRWFWRTMLVDEETGYVYSTNNFISDSCEHFIKYEPVKNRFTKLKSRVPQNSLTGLSGQMRAHTKHKTKDGWFMGVILGEPAGTGGELFKFFPKEDKVEALGLCWPGKYRYTASLAMSLDEKYVYYIPAAHGKSHFEGSPVVQYNVATGERKVLAFLFPYFYEKYGYITGGTYSINVDDKGETLFVVFNGAFTEFNPEGGDMFGDPSVMAIHIPASER